MAGKKDFDIVFGANASEVFKVIDKVQERLNKLKIPDLKATGSGVGGSSSSQNSPRSANYTGAFTC